MVDKEYYLNRDGYLGICDQVAFYLRMSPTILYDTWRKEDVYIIYFQVQEQRKEQNEILQRGGVLIG